VRWLYARAWLGEERPTALFEAAVARLMARKIILPGVSVLERLVARVRDRAAARLWRRLARAPDSTQRAALERLLLSTEEGRQTPLDRLRRGPTTVSSVTLVAAVRRLEEIRAVGVGGLDLAGVPPGRVRALARYALAARAQAVSRMPDDRRVAALLAAARVLEVAAHDDVVDVLDTLIDDLIDGAARVGKRERLRTLRDLDAAALLLRDVALIVRDPRYRDADLRDAIADQHGDGEIDLAMATVSALTRSPDDHYQRELMDTYPTIRRFLPAALRALTFHGTAASIPLREALDVLRALDGPHPPDVVEAPLAVVPPAWRDRVVGVPYRIDRTAYTACVLEQVRAALRRRDLYIAPSERWADPRAKLLSGPAWEASRPQVCRALGHELDPTAELAALGRRLDDAYRRTAANLDGNTAVRIERQGGRDTLVLSPLDKLDEPPSLRRLRAEVDVRLPHLDLPELLLEIHGVTGFADAFTHLSEGNARAEGLATSVCAVLLADACNIGLRAVARPDVPALTLDRLAWVRQNYVREETLAAANARLVDYHATLPLAKAWGGGEVASVDGLRFRVPVKTLNAGTNPKYFGWDRGATWLNASSDMATGLGGEVVAGTLRDSGRILDVILGQHTGVHPVEVMADTAAYAVMWTHAGQTRSLRGTRHGKEASRCASNACASRAAVRSLWCCSMTTTGRSRPCRGSSATSPRATTRRTPCRPMPTTCSTSCASSRGAVAPSRISRRRSRWTSSPTCARCPAGDMRNALASPCVRPRTASPPSACRPPRSTASSPPFRPSTNISSSRGNWTATTPCRLSTTRQPPVSPTATDPPWAAQAGNVPSVASSGSRRFSVSRAR